MREIEFRAWDKENKRMLPVDYILFFTIMSALRGV